MRTESRVVYPVKAKPPKPFPLRTAAKVFAIAGILALGVGFWYTMRLPALALNRVIVRGNARLPAGEIERVVLEALGGVRGRVFPKRNFFLANSGALEDTLTQRFPAAHSFRVAKDFPRTVTVEVRERDLWGIYCRRRGVEVASACAYLDTRGTAFEAVARFEGWLLPIIYGSDPPTLGTEAVSEATLERFSQARTALASAHARLLAMAVSTSTPDDLRLELAEGWHILVTASRPVDEWFGILRRVLSEEVGDRRAGLEYVDLRFGNKVFYKYR